MNAHTDARRRRIKFNVGRVLVLNDPPRLEAFDEAEHAADAEQAHDAHEGCAHEAERQAQHRPQDVAPQLDGVSKT